MRYSTNNCLKCLWSLLVLLISVAERSYGQAPVSSPEVSAPGKFDVQHIALDLRFDLERQQAAGSADITLSPLESTRLIALDAAFFTIEKVELNHRALVFHYDSTDRDNNLRITLDRVYVPADTITIHIMYRTRFTNASDPNNLWGSYGKGLRFFTPGATEPRRRPQIWSMGKPNGNRCWFPGKDTPGDHRTFELRATVPQPLTVISNGRLLEQQQHPDHTTTWHWKTNMPHENYQSGFVAGEYAVLKTAVKGVELYQYCYPDEVEATQASVERLPDIVHFFQQATGRAYPYDAYRQIFVQEFPWGGGATQGIAAISENMIDDYTTHADFFYLWDGVEAQDLAAQWFGQMIAPRDWSHHWLSGAFVTYFDALYSAHKNGWDEMQLWNRLFQLNTCMGDWGSGVRRPIVPASAEDPSTLCFDNFSLRGALVLHLLREEIGAARWDKVIQHYVNTHAGKTVTTHDFQQAVEAVTNTSWKWFFDQWIYRTGHPLFEVKQHYDAAQKQLFLQVKQTPVVDSTLLSSPSRLFQGKMTIALNNIRHTIQIASRPDTTYIFHSETKPDFIVFDVGKTWLCEIQFEKNRAEWMAQWLHSDDVMARQDAMKALSGIYRADDTPAAVRDTIAGAFRSVISGKAYWRLRYNALMTLQGMIGTQPPDLATEDMLLQVIQKEASWNRAAAIAFLGKSGTDKHAEVFLSYLDDKSDRVVNAAANALGKTHSPKAYDALMRLPAKPSWKNQSLISALNGLRELGDARGISLALDALTDKNAAARWTLATPVWDFRVAAAETLKALDAGKEGYPIVYQRYTQALKENNISDIFNNLLLFATLGDQRALALFPELKNRFAGDANALMAIEQYESQLK